MSGTVSEPRNVTKEAFERIPDAFKRYEVDRGELVEVEPVGNVESMIAARLIGFLFAHLRDPSTVEVLGPDARYRLSKDPELIRGCDVGYVPKERMPGGRPESGVGDYVPALVVEIVSPGNTAAGLARKIEEWLTAGARVVWVVYPEQRAVHVYHAPKDVRIVGVGDVLDGEPVLDGLEIPLEILFR